MLKRMKITMDQKNARQTILRQIREIEKLRKNISDLEINARKEEITNSINEIHAEWLGIMKELDEKHNEYERLVSDLKTIKNIMNNNVKIPWYKKIKNIMK